MAYYGLVITVSNDGFTRVWNLHADCLGEMQLPNISDDMKDNQLHCVKNGLWNLIVERKALSNEDQAIADKLVMAIQLNGTRESRDSDDYDPSIGDGMFSVSPSIQRISEMLAALRDPKNSLEDQNRISQLQSLVEAPSSLDSISLTQDIQDSSIMSAFSLKSLSMNSMTSPKKLSSVAELSFGSQTVDLYHIVQCHVSHCTMSR